VSTALLRHSRPSSCPQHILCPCSLSARCSIPCHSLLCCPVCAPFPVFFATCPPPIGSRPHIESCLPRVCCNNATPVPRSTVRVSRCLRLAVILCTSSHLIFSAGFSRVFNLVCIFYVSVFVSTSCSFCIAPQPLRIIHPVTPILTHTHTHVVSSHRASLSSLCLTPPLLKVLYKHHVRRILIVCSFFSSPLCLLVYALLFPLFLALRFGYC
jgi:hypothetical protein